MYASAFHERAAPDVCFLHLPADVGICLCGSAVFCKIRTGVSPTNSPEETVRTGGTRCRHRMKQCPTVLILGKLPPPYMGPAVATQILLNSSLKDHFHLLHLDTRINTSLESMGKWGMGKVLKNIGNYFRLLRINVTRQPSLVLVPVSQTTLGYLKDFMFIFLCKLTGRKVLLQLRGSNFKTWLDQTSMLTRSLVKLSMKWSEGVIVLGSKLKYLFTDYF